VSESPRDLYNVRFDAQEAAAKDRIWREIVAFLARWIDPNAPVLDIGCDRGHFIQFARGSERWASDIRDVATALPPDVRFVQASGLDLALQVPNGYFGTVFMSNYLEHLSSPDAVIEQLRVARQLLLPGGRSIVLQPNIRLVGPRYWDFIDHKVALTENSLVEAASIAGLRTVDVIVRFLPYSTKGRLPADPRLVRMYLRLPFAWRFLGRQTLYIGTPSGST
jgi:2-polyprenyl-3-methyl-5-hydroxy-6-metoxy-1,4-benzoquinol methylase